MVEERGESDTREGVGVDLKFRTPGTRTSTRAPFSEEERKIFRPTRARRRRDAFETNTFALAQGGKAVTLRKGRCRVCVAIRHFSYHSFALTMLKLRLRSRKVRGLVKQERVKVDVITSNGIE